MKFRKLHSTFSLLCLIFLLLPSSFCVAVYAWSNGGFSQDPSNPRYGTHDWIAEHALEWLPEEEKQYLINNIVMYLYGTELPDNGQAVDGIGDTLLHHIYFSSSGKLVDDSAAIRANATYHQALSYLKSGNLVAAAKYAGIMSHYIADMAVFGHVMGANTEWGEEKHHDDYESYVNSRTSSYNAEFNVYLSFDGNLDIISAYDAAIYLAYDTTFDLDGNLTCVWMDQNYNWSNPNFRNRAGESLNLAVNLIADVLHTLYFESVEYSPSAVVNFLTSGLSSDASGTVLMVDGMNYSYNQLPKSFTWDVGSSHSFEWLTPISASSEKQYVWVSTNGLSTVRSGFITVPSEGGLVAANYKAQYKLTITVNPIGTGSTDPSPGEYWYDAGSSFQISATPASGYVFSRWSGSGLGSYSGTSNPTIITMNEPITEIANFVQLSTLQWLLYISAIIVVTIFIIALSIKKFRKIQ